MTTVMERLTPIVEQIKASSALERERGLLSLKQLLHGDGLSSSLYDLGTCHAQAALMLIYRQMPWPAEASEDDQYAVEAILVGRIPWLVQSEQWTHRLAALSLSKANTPPFSNTPPLLCRALLAIVSLQR
jgi:hypothetical protein